MYRTWISNEGNRKNDNKRVITLNKGIITTQDNHLHMVGKVKIKTSKKLEIFQLLKIK